MPEILIVVLYLALGLFPPIPFTTILHELGHAIPALLFSNKEVQVYIGSYGGSLKYFNLKIGRLELLMHRNPLRWYKGMCKYNAETMSTNKQIIVALMGPLMTLLIAVLAACLIFTNDESHGALRFISLGLLIISVLGLIANLMPMRNFVKLDDGTRIANDGGKILIMLQLKKASPEYIKAFDLYSKGDYKEALNIMDPMIDGIKGKLAMYVVIHCLYVEQRYEEALSLYRRMAQRYKPGTEDLYLLSLIKHSMNDNEGAIRTSLLLLSSEPKHLNALNNIGYYFTCIGQYDHAAPFLTKALKIDPQHPFVINNMGLVLIKTGKAKEGLAYIEQSLAIDGTNAWAFRNKGIYYLETGDKETALTFFEKAKALNSDVPGIDELLNISIS